MRIFPGFLILRFSSSSFSYPVVLLGFMVCERQVLGFKNSRGVICNLANQNFVIAGIYFSGKYFLNFLMLGTFRKGRFPSRSLRFVILAVSVLTKEILVDPVLVSKTNH